MEKLIFCLSILLLLGSCTNRKSNETEITSAIDQFYKYASSQDSLVLKELISPGLKDLLKAANQVADADVENIKKSKNPSDKSAAIESFIFTGVPDTTTQKLEKITVTGNNAEATVELKIDEYKSEDKLYPAVRWENTIQLINDGGWKVDNIIFNEKPTLKQQLESFILEANKEPHERT